MDKKEIFKIGILMFTACLIFIFLFLLNIPVQKRNKAGLARQIQHVLDRQEDGPYMLGDPVHIAAPSQTSIAAYHLQGSHGDENYALILRITGLCGPVPAVFIYDKKTSPQFIGIAGYPPSDLSYKDTYPLNLRQGISDAQLLYWTQQIQKFFEVKR